MGRAILSALIGLWVMVSPAFMYMTQQAANNNHMAGPLAITFAVVAIWDINRNAIKVNILIGAWLLVALFLLPYNSLGVIVSNAVSGITLVFLALKKRTANQIYGGGWKSLFQHNPPHVQAADRMSGHAET